MEVVLAVAQRHFKQARALQTRADRIHAEHRRRDQHRVAPGRAERAHQQVDCLVAAATDQQLCRVRSHTAAPMRARSACGLRVRITSQAGIGIGCIRPRRFVGVEPDRAVQRFAARGAVAGEAAQVLAQQVGHGRSCRRTSAASLRGRALPGLPRAPVQPRPARSLRGRCGSTACTLIAFWKLATLRPLMARAAPPVGSTWLVPLQ